LAKAHLPNGSNIKATFGPAEVILNTTPPAENSILTLPFLFLSSFKGIKMRRRMMPEGGATEKSLGGQKAWCPARRDFLTESEAAASRWSEPTAVFLAHCLRGIFRKYFPTALINF
jgi:hypothetical protein